MNNDLISRSELKKHIAEIFEIEEKIDKTWAMGLKYSLKLIDNAPSVPLPDFKEGYKQAIIDGKTNFSRPTGEWIDGYCNKCGSSTLCDGWGRDRESKFCPHCGAKMIGEQDNGT